MLHRLSPVSPLLSSAMSGSIGKSPRSSISRYICEGIAHGFRIGFQCSSPLRSATTNMDSARQHPIVISEYLQKELSLGRMLGPFSDTESLPPLHVNRFGVIPKGHNSGKWRLITDLSFPPGSLLLFVLYNSG